MIHRLQAGYLHLFIDTYPRTGGKTWWRTGEIKEGKAVKNESQSIHLIFSIFKNRRINENILV